MIHGKSICNQLKAVRRSIAEENDIPLEIEECSYKGECRGTCPRCEAEVRYLENALTERMRLGKVATVAGLALGLAVSANAMEPPIETTHNNASFNKSMFDKTDSITLRGSVLDEKTGEEIPFCRVRLVDVNKSVVIDTVMDNGFSGDIILSVPKGEYFVYIEHIGYNNFSMEMVLDKDTDLGVIKLKQRYVQTISVGGCEVIRDPFIHTGNSPEYFQGIGNTAIVIR